MSSQVKMTFSLNGSWKMRKLDNGETVPAIVPGSMLNDLFNAGKIEDPFWRDNEKEVKKVFYEDYLYEKSFEILPEDLEYDKLELVCHGLDTLSEIYLNEELISKTDNMHRTWRFDIQNKLSIGKNHICIIFRSPLKFLDEKVKNSDITYTSTGCIPGNQYLRKAHCMFGWDWGPQLPDAGIWRDICIEGSRLASFDDVYVTQKHDDKQVKIKIDIGLSVFNTIKELKAKCTVTSPDGDISEADVEITGKEAHMEIILQNPKLWWPNGYGDHPLYNISLDLLANGRKVDSYTRKIGLRTLTVSQDKDEWGNEFAITVNSVKIFAMGADYIPEDSIISRVTRERTEKLIKSCTQANFNCIRVWGGAYYPDDSFYDLCDEYGLVIWQDLMFACNIYEMTDNFVDSITRETIDNVKRIRNHASLGLWCGNNEMELAWVEWDNVKYHSSKLKADYVRQFEILLPQILKDTDPETFYWRASPSSGGCFDDPNDKNRGDVHDWKVWHGFRPFTDYRKNYYRFCSEFGFESFPSYETVKSFTLEEDRNIFSKVMENHQKCPSGNGKILYYLAENFKYPKDFDSLLYVSQLLQMEGVRYGVEHWRRYRGRCMGAVYWQLNDCWPVASWASVDYYGRWKALQYGAKRFFSPIMVSVEDEGTNIKLFVHNETLFGKQGKVIVKLRDKNFNSLYEDTVYVSLESLSAAMIYKKDFEELVGSEKLKSETFLEAVLEVDGNVISKTSHIFVKAKHFDFDKVSYRISTCDEDERVKINIKSSSYARFVELSLGKGNCVFSDNYFDILSQEGATVYLDKKDIAPEELNDIQNLIKVRSIADSY